MASGKVQVIQHLTDRKGGVWAILVPVAVVWAHSMLIQVYAICVYVGNEELFDWGNQNLMSQFPTSRGDLGSYSDLDVPSSAWNDLFSKCTIEDI